MFGVSLCAVWENNLHSTAIYNLHDGIVGIYREKAWLLEDGNRFKALTILWQTFLLLYSHPFRLSNKCDTISTEWISVGVPACIYTRISKDYWLQSVQRATAFPTGIYVDFLTRTRQWMKRTKTNNWVRGRPYQSSYYIFNLVVDLFRYFFVSSLKNS